jgi:RNA polymerase sigma factor (sigma-70 family)
MACAQGYAALTDAQLLDAFVAHRDEGAFAALVRRHGPMVLGVCRRVLGNPHDAEDAFQSTFLVLVRKAGSIWHGHLLNNWLYGVACRTATKVKARTARWRAIPQTQIEVHAVAPENERAWSDLRPVLDQEVCRLPDRLRAAVVLCYLEGKSQEQAARLLGCPRGSVAGWLARARNLLHSRLTRRGVALSAGALMLFPWKADAADVSEALVSGTAQAAMALAPASIWFRSLPLRELAAVGVALLAGAILGVAVGLTDRPDEDTPRMKHVPPSTLKADKDQRHPEMSSPPGGNEPEPWLIDHRSKAVVFLAPPNLPRSNHASDHRHHLPPGVAFTHVDPGRLWNF